MQLSANQLFKEWRYLLLVTVLKLVVSRIPYGVGQALGTHINIELAQYDITGRTFFKAGH